MKANISTLLLCLITQASWAQVEELNNTEMTEAYIEDGTIVVKQKATTPQTAAKKTPNYKIGKIDPLDVEQENISESQQQTLGTLNLLQQDTNQKQAELQLQGFDQSQTVRHVNINPMLSPVAQSQQDAAYAIVRNGLNLPSDAAITPDLLSQYLSGFAGQSTGNPLNAQQTITNTGIQFIIPNNQQISPGLHTSGDGNVNTQVNDQQLLFNIIFPKP